MKLKNRIKALALVAAALLVFTASSSAQAVDDPILKACEETADKAKRLEIENLSLKAQLEIEKEKTANANDRVLNAKEQADFWKKAAQTGDKIDVNSGQIIFQLRQQVADDRVRIAELESDNKSLRSSRNWRTAIGLGAGFAAGYYIRDKN